MFLCRFICFAMLLAFLTIHEILNFVFSAMILSLCLYSENNEKWSQKSWSPRHISRLNFCIKHAQSAMLKMHFIWLVLQIQPRWFLDFTVLCLWGSWEARCIPENWEGEGYCEKKQTNYGLKMSIPQSLQMISKIKMVKRSQKKKSFYFFISHILFSLLIVYIGSLFLSG